MNTRAAHVGRPERTEAHGDGPEKATPIGLVRQVFTKTPRRMRWTNRTWKRSRGSFSHKTTVTRNIATIPALTRQRSPTLAVAPSTSPTIRARTASGTRSHASTTARRSSGIAPASGSVGVSGVGFSPCSVQPGVQRVSDGARNPAS